LSPKKADSRFDLATSEYEQLVAFRYALRTFLHFSEAAAKEEGLTSQHYQAMLVLRARPDDQPVSINDLAQQLLIKHNSAVGLVDRLVGKELVVREPSTVDRRRVDLRLTARGKRVLSKLALMHQGELRRIGPLMTRFFSKLTRERGAAG
jgi:DNA-binding MarR family transcriptional regulator